MMDRNFADTPPQDLVLQAAEQDANPHSIFVENLTKQIEQGHACSVKEVLHSMPFEESLKTLSEIERRNKVDRIEDPNVPALYFHTEGNDSHATAYLNRPAGPHWWYGYEIPLQDTLGLYNTADFNAGDRKTECKDLSAPEK
jgi:hypothetical protein